MTSEPGDGEASIEPAAAELAREIRRRKRAVGLSNADLAGIVGYSRQYVGYAERPSRGLPSAALVAALDTALDGRGALVALHKRACAARDERRESAIGRAAADLRPKQDEHLQRRQFLANVAAAAVGVAVPTSLARLLDGLDAGPPRRVGIAEVEAVEAAVDAYMRFDLARSGDLAATMARTALNWSTELLKAEMSASTRERLWSAAGLLADRLGWSLYDVGATGKAGTMLTFALDHAARGADRDLRAHVMLDLSTVVTDAGHPHDGVEILRAALGDERISVAERANLHAVCARHCATAGQREPGLRHVALADEALAGHDVVRGPAWARRITHSPGHHDSAVGLALFALGDSDRARQRLTSAVSALDTGRTRTGLRCRIRLAALALREGETTLGEAEGYRVIADATGVRSARIRADLTMLRADAIQHDAPDLAAGLTPLLAS